MLRDQAVRNFTNQILWQIDPDSVLLREHYHNLSQVEVRSLALYAGLSAGVMMTSDDLGELGEERLRLLKMILNPERRSCRFPLLGEAINAYTVWTDFEHRQKVLRTIPDDPVLVQVRDLHTTPESGNKKQMIGAVLFLNTGERSIQRSYPMKELGLPTPLHVFDWTNDYAWPNAVDVLPIIIAPYDCVLLFLSTELILATPESLT